LYGKNDLSNLPPDQLRIRDKGMVRKLDVPPDKLEAIEKIMKSKISSQVKKSIIKSLTSGSMCCSCGGIPMLEVKYDVSDERQACSKIERYCDSCAKKVYERK
jgi:hypothetical protein